MEEEIVDSKKLKSLALFIVPDSYLVLFYPHRKTIMKDLTKVKAKLEEMGI